MVNYLVVLKLFGGIDEISESHRLGEKRRRPFGVQYGLFCLESNGFV
jgi:hypothetical protein